MSLAQMDKAAQSMSDIAWPKRMGAAKEKLLRECKIESPFPPQFN
jgi:hypothetical protein